MKLVHKKSGGKANVVLVDWSTRSQNICINKVAANTRVVGEELIRFLEKLSHVVFGNYDFSKYLLMGHSFGAQIIGRAGFKIWRKYRISHPATSRLGGIIAHDPSDQ